MSINVKHTTKVFNGQAALNDVSLKIPSGQILGLLGPNGAGKSTLMRLISGYLPTTSGYVEVCGFDAIAGDPDFNLRLSLLDQTDFI